MEQLSTLLWGLVVVVSVLIALGAAAASFGADSRPCIGDSHTGAGRTDWI